MFSNRAPTPHFVGDVARLDDLEFDQNTYRGRFLFFASMTDPRTLLTTGPQLRDAQLLLRRVRERSAGWEGVPVDAYLDAQRRVRAIVHPETNRPIPLPFRFSSFVPANFVTLCGMLHPTQQTPWRSMLWQWVNQTYNVGFNYCNASGEMGLSLRDLLLGYLVATTTACSLSFALNRLAAGPRTPPLLRAFIPYTAVACANIANVSVIRFPDLLHGIPVKDVATGEELAGGLLSPTAGRMAVAQVALSRVLIPVPLMIVPPIIMESLFSARGGVRFFAQRRAQLYMPVNVAVIVSVLCLALPLSIAVFPQDVTMRVSQLEPAFLGQRNSREEEVTLVCFNKGL